jgi:hypothetical protein
MCACLHALEGICGFQVYSFIEWVLFAKETKTFCDVSETEKCLKVVHETSDTKVTLGDAMLTCTLDNARLAAVKSCDVMDLMMEEIFAQFVMDAQTYFVGIFALKDVEGLSYRNWEDNMVIDS